jgi:type II secretory pathway pseudopilin PulG
MAVTSRSTTSSRRHSSRIRGAFTIVEAAISMVIVAIMLVAALSAVGASARARRVHVNVGQGAALARALMAEIRHARYEEPIDDPPAFGRETGETTVDRLAWDDVDDYHGWSAAPPVARDGSALPGFAGWSRSVSVHWVTVNELNSPAAGETGLKMVSVEVVDPDGAVTELVSLRAAHGPEEQMGTAEMTYVAWVGVDLEVGGSAAAISQGTELLNQVPE